MINIPGKTQTKVKKSGRSPPSNLRSGVTINSWIEEPSSKAINRKPKVNITHLSRYSSRELIFERVIISRIKTSEKRSCTENMDGTDNSRSTSMVGIKRYAFSTPPTYFMNWADKLTRTRIKAKIAKTRASFRAFTYNATGLEFSFTFEDLPLTTFSPRSNSAGMLDHFFSMLISILGN